MAVDRGHVGAEPSPGLAASSLVESRVGLVGRVCSAPFVGVILVYRAVLSPILGGQCRFEPTCSRYALEAYRLWGPVKGTRLTVGRVLRCHPLSRGGLDPVELYEDAKDRGGTDDDGEQTPGGAEA